MKLAVFAMLPAVCLQAQWITGHFAANNGTLPVSSIPWSKYTHIIHFAAAPNANGTVRMHYLVQAEINSLIASRPAGKKVVVCIKDNDSDLSAFAQATDSGSITTFVNNITTFVNSNGYDGVDIDWEVNVNVTQYRDLLARLRSALPGKVIAIDTGNWNNLESVAGASHSNIDQVNIMCYDMDDPGNGYSWHNDPLLQNGNPNVMSCDWRVRAFTNAGVPKSKIGIGIPYYGRRWPGVRAPMVNVSPSFQIYTVLYRNLVRDSARWQPLYQVYDNTYKANYLSIPSLNEFVSYNGAQSIKDAVAWQRAQGFGGFMTFTIDYEYLSNQSGDARYPLSTVLQNEVFGSGSTPPPSPSPPPTLSSGSPTGVLNAATVSTVLSVITNENATCRYATQPGISYSSMPQVFAVTGNMAHSAVIKGLLAGLSYKYYVRCSDVQGSVNTTDYAIAFSVASLSANSAPTPLGITPNSGSGSSGTFTVQVMDTMGFSTIQRVRLLFDTAAGKINSCLIEYWAATSTLSLRSDDKATWSQAALGSSATLKNSQCSVAAAGSSVSGSASNLTLTVAMNFFPAYAGTKNLLALAIDAAGLSSGWRDLGNWTVPAPAATGQPLTAQISPINGSARAVTFVLRATDTSGYSAIRQVALFVGNALGATPSCSIEFWAPTGTVSLRNSANNGWHQGSVSSSTVLQNNWCIVSLGPAAATGSGDTLTLSLPITFLDAFGGTRNVYVFVADQYGRITNWLNPGDWTVP